MRIAIVNDLRMAVEILRRIVLSKPGLEVAWIAEDGEQAVRMCAQDTPDLVLMDLIMPGVNGVEATRRIMRDSPCPILVVTATVEGNVHLVFEAMSHGALDAVNTPAATPAGFSGAEELLRKIESVARLTGRQPALQTAILSRLPRLLLIGASTGGPAVIAEILRELPEDLPAAVLIAQHVDPAFLGDFAQWLTRQGAHRCGVAQAGQEPRTGEVLLARSDSNLYIGENGTLGYMDSPADNFYQPSVNILFASAARCWPSRGTALLLTGMGSDGASGLLELRKAGWLTIAQDEATAVVYGMPRAAAEIGAAAEILPTTRIPARLLEFYGTRNSGNCNGKRGTQ